MSRAPGEGLALLRRRIAETPAQLRAFDPAALAAALAEDEPPRALVASGAGSSLEHARLLCALLAAAGAPAARLAPPSALLAPPGPGARETLLVVFSQGLSPNGRALLAHARAWRRVLLVTGVAPEAEDAERAAALAQLAEAGGRVLRLPAPREAGLLLRVIGPLLGAWAAIEMAGCLARAHARDAPAPLPAERVCAALDAAAERGRALRARLPRDPLAGELAILAGAAVAPGASALARKLLEGLLVPLPAVWDLVDFAHGGFQQLFARRATLLAPLAPEARSDAALLARAEAMLDPARHRVLRLEARLPAPFALLEHEVTLNELLADAIEARGIDPARWPGRDRDAPLYALSSPPEADPAPRELARLAWPELDALLAAGSRSAVLPLGSTEQHGPHLPFATDTLVADALAAGVCARVAGSVRLPALPFGCASEHLGFPGTIHLAPETLLSILEDALASLARHGFRRALVFSAHGGNTGLLRDAAPRLARAAPGLDVVVFADAGRVEAALLAAAARFGVAPEAAGHHAGEIETSLLLALAPGDVRAERRAPGLAVAGGDAQAVFYPDLRARAPSGVVGDPTGARPERAAAYLEAWVDVLVEAFEGAKNRACAKGTNQA